MDKILITKLLSSFLQKEHHEISFTSEKKFILLKQLQHIEIPYYEAQSITEQRAIIDLIILLFTSHSLTHHEKLIKKHPEHNVIISQLSELRIFLIAADNFLGIKQNINSYITDYYQHLIIDQSYGKLGRDILLLLLKEAYPHLYREHKITTDLVKKFDHHIKQIYCHRKTAIKYYDEIETMLSKIDLNCNKQKSDNINKEKTAARRKSNNNILEKYQPIIEQLLENDTANNESNDLEIEHISLDHTIKKPVSINKSTNNNMATAHISKSNNKQLPYKIYSNKFDEISHAANIFLPEEKQYLWLKLKPYLNDNIAYRNLQKLAVSFNIEKQHRFNFHEDKGILDNKKLSLILANKDYLYCYKNINQNLSQNYHITFLLDNSGSMSGDPIINTIRVAFHLCKVLEKFNINTEILGYTTKSWQGGESYRLWRKSNSPHNPGRVNDLRHIIYKSASDNINYAKKNLSLMLKNGFLKENIDGEALTWAIKRLKSAQAKRKIIVVISDGSPMDEITLELNNKKILEEHLAQVISHSKKLFHKNNIKLIGCGIGYDISQIYDNFINLKNYEELNNKFINKFVKLIM